MITKVKSFAASDGSIHPSLEAAQTCEVRILLGECETELEPAVRESFAIYMVKNATRFADVLTTRATSRPATRKVNGGKKEKKAKPTVVAASA